VRQVQELSRTSQSHPQLLSQHRVRSRSQGTLEGLHPFGQRGLLSWLPACFPLSCIQHRPLHRRADVTRPPGSLGSAGDLRVACAGRAGWSRELWRGLPLGAPGVFPADGLCGSFQWGGHLPGDRRPSTAGTLRQSGIRRPAEAHAKPTQSRAASPLNCKEGPASAETCPAAPVCPFPPAQLAWFYPGGPGLPGVLPGGGLLSQAAGTNLTCGSSLGPMATGFGGGVWFAGCLMGLLGSSEADSVPRPSGGSVCQQRQR